MHSGRDATQADAGRVCPFCRFLLKAGTAVHQCHACSALHHTECWDDNHGCAIAGCSAGPGRETAGWDPPTAPTSTPAAAPPPTTTTPGRASRGLAAALVLLAIAISGVAAAIVLTHPDAGEQAAAPAAASTSSPDPPPATPEDTSTPEPTPTEAATSEPTETQEEPVTPVPQVQANQPVRFHTGTDAGKAMPATYCRITSKELYCWTPNDGYTLRLASGVPVRVRADERANRGRLPGVYDLLAPGRSRSRYGFRCTSRRSGLTCQSASGHGWTLPRYVGLPALF